LLTKKRTEENAVNKKCSHKGGVESGKNNRFEKVEMGKSRENGGLVKNSGNKGRNKNLKFEPQISETKNG